MLNEAHGRLETERARSLVEALGCRPNTHKDTEFDKTHQHGTINSTKLEESTISNTGMKQYQNDKTDPIRQTQL